MREPPQSSAIVAVNVRLPADLHARLVQLAAKEYRSLNRQMLALMEEGLAERQQREEPRAGSARSDDAI